MIRKWRIHWIGQTETEVIQGRGIPDAFRNAGYGGGAINAVDHFENIPLLIAFDGTSWKEVSNVSPDGQACSLSGPDIFPCPGDRIHAYFCSNSWVTDLEKRGLVAVAKTSAMDPRFSGLEIALKEEE